MKMALMIMVLTYISFSKEHGISYHGREEEGDTTREPLQSGEVAPGGTGDNAQPEVLICQLLSELHIQFISIY